MSVQGIMFLVTISKNIKLITVEMIKDRTNDTLFKALDATFRVYNGAGYDILKIHADPEFRPLKDTLRDIDITLNMCSDARTCSGD